MYQCFFDFHECTFKFNKPSLSYLVAINFKFFWKMLAKKGISSEYMTKNKISKALTLKIILLDLRLNIY